MNVGKLKLLLEDYDDSDEVILSDAEGNVFSPLSEILSGYFLPEDDALGDFVEMDEIEEDDEISIEESIPAIALYPSI